jgi:hypothetical protein
MPKVCLDDYPELPRWVPSRTAGHSSRSGSEVLISVGVCHFTLQGAHSSTIAEATGRATMFLGAVSGGLVALGLIATAAGVSTAFYAFALILLPALALLELVTFNWALQSGIEDFGYASRIAQFRGFYFHYAPELVDYLRSVPPAERLRLQGIGRSRWQKFFTAAAMVGLVTAVLAGSTVGLVTAVLTGSTVGLLSAIVSDHVLVAAITAGVLVATAVFAGTDPLPTLELAAGGRARAHRRVSRDE